MLRHSGIAKLPGGTHSVLLVACGRKVLMMSAARAASFSSSPPGGTKPRVASAHAVFDSACACGSVRAPSMTFTQRM